MKRTEIDPLYEGLHRSFFGAVDPRRRQELKDSKMVDEGRSSIANLSPKPINRQFNQNRYVEHFKDDMYEVSGE